MPRQIQYQQGEDYTDNHQRHIEAAIRLLTIGVECQMPSAIDYINRTAALLPAAPVEQPPQKVQPGQQVVRIDQPAQAQVPVRIEQVLQPVAPQPQLPQVVRVEQSPPVYQVDPPVGQAEPVVRVGQPGVVAQPVPPVCMFPSFYPGFNPVQLPRPDVYEGSPDLSVFKNRYEAYARQYNWDLIQQAASIRLYLRGIRL